MGTVNEWGYQRLGAGGRKRKNTEDFQGSESADTVTVAACPCIFVQAHRTPTKSDHKTADFP